MVDAPLSAVPVRRPRAGAVRTAIAVAAVAGLVSFAVASAPWRVLDRLDGRGLGLLGLVVALYLVNGVVKAARWRGILSAMGERLALGRVYRAWAVGMAVNNLLPAGVAGEPVRARRLADRLTAPVVASVAADRALDLLVLGVVALVAAPALVGGTAAPLVAAVALALAVVVAAVAVRMLGRREDGVLGRALSSFAGALGRLGGRRGALAGAAGLTVVVQANDAVRLALVAAAFDERLGVLTALAIMALGTFAGLVAVTAGSGLALSTGALLVSTGVDAEAAAAIAIAFVATSTWISLPVGIGAWLWPAHRSGGGRVHG